MIILLCVGNKTTQTRDIEPAIKILANIEMPDKTLPDEKKPEQADE